MNKSLLIVICDFLLLSLLSLARFDEAPPGQPADAAAAAPGAAQSDLMSALQAALDQEQRSRAQLQTQLEQSRTQVKTQEQLLAERDSNLRSLQENLKLTEEQARLLDQERQALDQQVVASVRSIVDLESQLNQTATESKVNQARLEALQTELKMREREAERLQERLQGVEQRHQAAEAEKQQLAVKLQVTEAEKQLVREQLVATREQVVTTQKEKEQIQEHAKVLAEGVSTLAEKSDALSMELRENRGLSGNLVFTGFISNRVESEFTARKSGLLGQSGDTKLTKTILVSSGGQIYAIYHAQETMLNVAGGQAGWEYLFGNIRRSSDFLSLDTLSFLHADPRVVLAPITAEQARQLKVAIYPLAKEPLKFNEAVLVGGGEGYYGEAPFQVDPETPKYVRLQRERFDRFFGKFTPSSGDLVFSRTGEVLGIMVNSEYCLVLDDLTPGGTVTLGATIQDPKNTQVLASLGARVGMLPAKVR